MNKTLVLLSGGLDSTVVLALSKEAKVVCAAIGFDYGQAHKIELEKAEGIAKHYDVMFERVRLPVLPHVDDVVFAGRNMILAAMAVGIAQASGFTNIAIGCNKSDWEHFPDCRPSFWEPIKRAAETYGIIVETPLLYDTKQDIVKLAKTLGVPIEKTWSCYAPNAAGEPCGKCLACEVRNQAL